MSENEATTGVEQGQPSFFNVPTVDLVKYLKEKALATTDDESAMWEELELRLAKTAGMRDSMVEQKKAVQQEIDKKDATIAEFVTSAKHRESRVKSLMKEVSGLKAKLQEATDLIAKRDREIEADALCSSLCNILAAMEDSIMSDIGRHVMDFVLDQKNAEPDSFSKAQAKLAEIRGEAGAGAVFAAGVASLIRKLRKEWPKVVVKEKASKPEAKVVRRKRVKVEV